MEIQPLFSARADGASGSADDLSVSQMAIARNLASDLSPASPSPAARNPGSARERTAKTGRRNPRQRFQRARMFTPGPAVQSGANFAGPAFPGNSAWLLASNGTT